MENLVLAYIFMFFGLTSTLCRCFPNQDRTNANLVYLGSVDGKSFFAQSTPEMTWFQANERCTESGMKLASITSIEQRTFLSQVYNNVTFTGHFWTSARSALTPSQLVWDSDKGPLNDSVVSNYYDFPGILTCLTFVSFSNTFNFHNHLCTEIVGALCEINLGKKVI